MRSASFGEAGEPGLLRPIGAGVFSGWLEEPPNGSGGAERSNDPQPGVPRDGRGLDQRSRTLAMSRRRGHFAHNRFRYAAAIVIGLEER